jgi:hypothetical protein
MIAHHCHWPGCGVIVPPRLWGCKKHWFMLPKNIRDAIWRAYVPGQEISKTPSHSYIRVAREAQDWINTNFPQQLELRANGQELGANS